MSAVSVRYASASEAELIAEMSRQTFYETFAAKNTRENMELFMREMFSMEKLLAEVPVPGNTFLLAFENDLPVGYVKMQECKSRVEFGQVPAIEIARIYAVRSAIGKGVGHALMQKCIEIAVERKKRIIWLGVWEHNRPAIDFYRKWGFVEFGSHFFKLGNDIQTDWLMKKDL